jgi:restriction endonuclease S subunit
MKTDWKTKTLEEVSQFSNGLWKGEKPPFVNVGVIRNTNFTKEGTLDDSDIAYIDVEARKFEKRRLQFGDIILEKSGGGPKQPVGRVALFDKEDGDFSFSNFTAAVRVLNTSELDFRFLHKFLHWTYLSGITEGMQSHSTGIRNLDGDAYKAIKICFPALPEQQRIVGILDEAFEGIARAKANAERNIQNARAQEISVDRVLESIADGRGRVLLTLATGTGKTSVAFQIAWKLFSARWNLTDWKSREEEPTRRPRILFLADRNNLADQAYNDFTSFAAFADDALVRINPEDIRKKGRVPKNGSVFFTIFQTFMSGPPKDGNPSPYFSRSS